MSPKLKKSEIIEILTEKEIEFDPNATVAVLEALLPEEPKAPKEKIDEDEDAEAAEAMEKIPTGNPNIEVPEGYVKDVVDEDKLAELQKEKRLFGYNPVTKEASFKPKKKVKN